LKGLILAMAWADWSWLDCFWAYIYFGCVTGWMLVIWETVKFFYNWWKDRSSYNTTLRHIFRTIQKLRKTRGQKDLSTLDVHIVSRRPLYHCDPWWSIFKFGLERERCLDGWIPGLKTLNLTFIVQEEDTFKKTVPPVHKFSGNRTVNYSIKHMLYHMFYSEDEYTEPDAVVILDNEYTMLGEEDELHRDISYRNITGKARTALVLVDRTTKQLDKGVTAVNEARPVDEEYNQYMSTDHSRYKFTILRRKNANRKLSK